jgi:mono/diheme cytochrome c family protein
MVGAFTWLLASKATKETVTVTVGSTSATVPTGTSVKPAVAAGAYSYVAFGCEACHGPQGNGGPSPVVPKLSTLGTAYSTAQLQHIITHGLGVVNDPHKPYMPVWGAVISEQQTSDLAAYIRAGLPAVPGAQQRPVPVGASAAATGSVLYENLGCINCHGPNGLGGVPNPSSPDKTIPPLSGASFKGEFTPAKIRDVIRTGSVLGKQPIVSMPHWGGILTPAQIDALVAYIQTLT